MYKHKIELVTKTDIRDFVNIVSSLDGEIKLIDGLGMCVNGKSILGVVAAIEWNSLYCLSENDIYTYIQQFCVAEGDLNECK